MAHTLQERYSSLVDKKLRAVLVTKDGVIFNNRYEGNPKAGAVKIPVRDTEVAASAYDKAAGIDPTVGTTTYLTATIDKDYAVNEIIDGYDAAAVPDSLVADRLDSAAYSLASRLDEDGIAALVAGGTANATTTALTKSTIYEFFVDERTALSEAKVPNDGRRWAIVTPSVYGLILKSPEFISASNLGDDVKQTGALGKIAGFLVFEGYSLGSKVEVITGHPDWATRVREWSVPVHLQDLSGSGKYIGASAGQGRNVYAHKVTKAAVIRVKKTA